MNIFVTDKCPIQSAKNLDDKRVVKMVLESAQMLCTAINFHGGKAPYLPTHINHPCTVWARTNRANFFWLHRHFVALCDEYTSRYNKTHKCAQYIGELESLSSYIPDGELTPFANCAANQSVGISYKHMDDVVSAYKLYLDDRWSLDKRTPTWYGEL